MPLNVWGPTMTPPPEEQPGHPDPRADSARAIEVCSAVVSRCRAQPGHEAVLRELQARVLREHLSHTAHSQQGWVLHGMDDPRQVLSVHECANVATYLQATARAHVQQQIAEHAMAPVQHTFYRTCAFYENMGVKPALVTGVRIEVPVQRADTLDKLLQLITWPTLKALPELVLRVCYQEAAAPQRFLLIHGWRSQAAYESVISGVRASAQPALATLGARSTYLIARD
jgi:hypothetical protein